jgi:hypothetical protein
VIEVGVGLARDQRRARPFPVVAAIVLVIGVQLGYINVVMVAGSRRRPDPLCSAGR